jgi:hypothetical protein
MINIYYNDMLGIETEQNSVCRGRPKEGGLFLPFGAGSDRVTVAVGGRISALPLL